MDIGINILKGVRVRLGDNIDEFKQKLIDNNVEYKEHNTELIDNNTIIYMKKYGVELSVKANMITYIKSNNTELNYIMELDEETDCVKKLDQMRNKIANIFNLRPESIRVDEYDGDNIGAVFTVIREGLSIRITIVQGIQNKIYVSTLRLL